MVAIGCVQAKPKLSPAFNPIFEPGYEYYNVRNHLNILITFILSFLFVFKEIKMLISVLFQYLIFSLDILVINIQF